MPHLPRKRESPEAGQEEMTHDIPEDTLNSNINYCIDEYVRLEQHREMLRDKWFRGVAFDKLAEKYGVSLQTAKNVVYDIGDPILVRAANMRSPTD